LLFGRSGAIDVEPVVKLFTSDGNPTWLFAKFDPNGYHAIGLCDLDQGEPELGYGRRCVGDETDGCLTAANH
jgi:hypothetical protein